MKNSNYTIRLNIQSREKIKKIAETFDLTYNNEGSIRQLLQAIADNDLIVLKNFSKKT
jgi:hypothetical protein